MALPDYISLFAHPRMAASAIKSAWNSMVHLHPGEALSTLAKIAGDVLMTVSVGLGAYLIYDVLKNNNLKTSKKIIPIIGFGLAMALAIPVSIAVIVGASFLVPPFMFVASVGATIRNAMVYWSDRKERNSLRKELQTTADMERLIRGLKLNSIDREKINTYTFGQQKIYQSFYQLRSMIIKTTTISIQDRQLLVAQINKAIEDFSKGQNKDGQFSINLDCELLEKLPAVKEVIKQSKDELEKNVQSYHAAGIAVEQIPAVSPSVLRSINQYKFTREKVASQDLPEYIKNEIVAVLEKKKVSKDEIKLLYSQLGNHYLNITADKQLKAQDDNFVQYYLTALKEPNAIKDITQYIQTPRDLITSLQALNRDLNQDMVLHKETKEQLEKLIQEIIALPDLPPLEQWSNIETQLRKTNKVDEKTFEQIREQLYHCQQVASDYSNINLDEALRERIVSQKQITLSQHANLGMQFDSPRIDLKLNKNNLIKRVTDYVAAKNSLIDETVDLIQEQTFKEPVELADKNRVKENAKLFKKDFSEKFANTFDVVEKKEKLRFLEHAVPKRLMNVGLCLGLAVISFATSVLIPAVASPAAPVAAAALTGLSVVSGLFTAFSISISLKITVDLLRSENKVNKPKTRVKEGIAPDIGYDKKNQAKFQKEHAKKMGNKKEDTKKTVVKTNPLYNATLSTSTITEVPARKEEKTTASDKDKLLATEKKNSPSNP